MPYLSSRLASGLMLAVAASSGLISCALDPAANAPSVYGPEQRAAGLLDPTDDASLERLLDETAQRRVFHLGEIHDRFDHHVNQLRIIRGLSERDHDLAIGLEAFQEPFQSHLDAYVQGRIDETEMLRRTQYYDRWRFDFRLYRDILRFARAQRIPLVALNAPTELVEAVSKDGIGGLDPDQRSQLPARIAPADAAYEKRLRRAFAMHGNLPEERFKRFVEVQSVWDEYMAREAADYLARNPDKTLVLLVGSAHVLHESAIPGRLRRRYPVDDAVIVTAPFKPVPGVEPDYILAARDIELGRRGRTGMTLLEDNGGIRVKAVSPGSAAQKAGVEPGDRVLSIEGLRVYRLSDVRLALTDSGPGDRLSLETRRADNQSAEIEKRVLTLL